MRLWREKIVISMGIQAVIVAVLMGIEREQTIAPPGWLVSSLDRVVPFSAYAVWPYVSWYAAPAALLALGRREFRRASAAVLLAFLACAIGYVLWPVGMDRPPITQGEDVSGALLKIVYSVDPPRNIFPSFHAALCTIVVSAMPRNRPRRLVAVWAIVVCMSCVVTKQHYVLDVVAGLVLGSLAVIAVDSVAPFLGDAAGDAADPSSSKTVPVDFPCHATGEGASSR